MSEKNIVERIKNLLEAYQKETGLTITTIFAETAPDIMGGKPVYVQIKIECSDSC